MTVRELSHGRCVQRVCCPSWSCTPHLAGCPAIDDWARATTTWGADGYLRPPIVIDDTVRPGRVELRNDQGQVIGAIELKGLR